MTITKVYIVYYSLYGHVEIMAREIQRGANTVPGVEAKLWKVAETLPERVLEKMKAPAKPDDVPEIRPEQLVEADGFIFGFPSRFGVMAAQCKAFFDATQDIWATQALAGKPAGIFWSTGFHGGGQELTALTAITQLAHHGMVFVPLGYKFGNDMFEMNEVKGGSCYGSGTYAADGSRHPTHLELQQAFHQEVLNHKSITRKRRKQSLHRVQSMAIQKLRPPGPQAAQLRHSGIVRCIAMVLITLIILASLIVLINWLLVQPKKLKYSIEDGSVSGYNLSNDHHLNATFHLVLRANNPNKRVSLYYDKIEVSVSCEDQKLSVNNISPFYQPRKNVTHMNVNLEAKNVTLHEAVARDLKMERTSGNVELDVKFRAKIRLKLGVLRIHGTLKLLCGPLSLPFSSSKEFKRVSCDVHGS
ncbi:putative NAD(P)H dehydrogenase (quinone) FQR1-like 3 [Abeliophyllum distichum]|uniref:NAD(P)H dehydrogenase (quinone) n=1 Tax=Abeliophyllum distichum TaxID=126358 RepID=A0ABD1TF49_9LAMI